MPTLVLLLDGNLHTSAIGPLKSEIDELSEMKGLQIVYCNDQDLLGDLLDPLNWHRLEIQSLSLEEIQLKIGEKGPENFRAEIRDLVKSRTWLTRLFEFYDKIGGAGYDFKPNFSTEGEFLWNYFEAKISGRLPDTQEKINTIRRFYLRQFIPSVIFRMLKLGKRELSEEKLFDLIKEVSGRFYNRGFLRSFPEYRLHFRHFP